MTARRDAVTPIPERCAQRTDSRASARTAGLGRGPASRGSAGGKDGRAATDGAPRASVVSRAASGGAVAGARAKRGMLRYRALRSPTQRGRLSCHLCLAAPGRGDVAADLEAPRNADVERELAGADVTRDGDLIAPSIEWDCPARQAVASRAVRRGHCRT